MTINHFKNSSIKEHEWYDLIIVGLSHEARSRNILEKYLADAERKFYIDECGGSTLYSYLDNLSRFKESGFSPLNVEHLSDFLGVDKSLDENRQLTALIDISCLFRPTLAAVISAVHTWANSRKILVTFAYSIAAYTEPTGAPQPNEEIAPVHDHFSGWPSTYSYPTSLVVGLGYEPEKAEGATEYLDPSEFWGFVPVSPVTEFLPAVERNNHGLIQRLKQSGREIRYRLDDCESTFGQIEIVLSDLLERTNPILLPFGPKIFFVLCLIHGLQHREVGIWHVTGEKNEGPVEKIASGTEVVFTVGIGEGSESIRQSSR